jgi:hypothetical protein
MASTQKNEEMRQRLREKFPDLVIDETCHLVLPEDQESLAQIARRYPGLGKLLEDPSTRNLAVKRYRPLKIAPSLLLIIRGQNAVMDWVLEKIGRAARGLKDGIK